MYLFRKLPGQHRSLDVSAGQRFDTRVRSLGLDLELLDQLAGLLAHGSPMDEVPGDGICRAIEITQSEILRNRHVAHASVGEWLLRQQVNA